VRFLCCHAGGGDVERSEHGTSEQLQSNSGANEQAPRLSGKWRRFVGLRPASRFPGGTRLSVAVRDLARVAGVDRGAAGVTRFARRWHDISEA